MQRLRRVAQTSALTILTIILTSSRSCKLSLCTLYVHVSSYGNPEWIFYLTYSFPLQLGKRSKKVENSTGDDDLYEMVLRSQVSSSIVAACFICCLRFLIEFLVQLFHFLCVVSPYRGSALGATAVCAHGTRRGLLRSHTSLAIKQNGRSAVFRSWRSQASVTVQAINGSLVTDTFLSQLTIHLGPLVVSNKTGDHQQRCEESTPLNACLTDDWSLLHSCKLPWLVTQSAISRIAWWNIAWQKCFCKVM